MRKDPKLMQLTHPHLTESGCLYQADAQTAGLAVGCLNGPPLLHGGVQPCPANR